MYITLNLQIIKNKKYMNMKKFTHMGHMGVRFKKNSPTLKANSWFTKSKIKFLISAFLFLMQGNDRTNT